MRLFLQRLHLSVLRGIRASAQMGVQHEWFRQYYSLKVYGEVLGATGDANTNDVRRRVSGESFPPHECDRSPRSASSKKQVGRTINDQLF